MIKYIQSTALKSSTSLLCNSCNLIIWNVNRKVLYYHVLCFMQFSNNYFTHTCLVELSVFFLFSRSKSTGSKWPGPCVYEGAGEWSGRGGSGRSERDLGSSLQQFTDGMGSCSAGPTPLWIVPWGGLHWAYMCIRTEEYTMNKCILKHSIITQCFSTINMEYTIKYANKQICVGICLIVSFWGADFKELSAMLKT